MMNLNVTATIGRAIVGASIGYAIGKFYDSFSDTKKNDDRQPIEKAEALPLYKLAHENSVGWFQQKLQDAVDMLATGTHQPKKRVLVTNAMARDFRARALREIPHRNSEGHLVHGVGLTISGLYADIVDEELNAAYNLSFCVEFKKIGGVIVPAAHLHDSYGNLDERWYSYADAFKALHKATAAAIRITSNSGCMVSCKKAGEAYELGKELGRKEASRHKVTPAVAKAPVVKMAELSNQEKDDDDEFI